MKKKDFFSTVFRLCCHRCHIVTLVWNSLVVWCWSISSFWNKIKTYVYANSIRMLLNAHKNDVSFSSNITLFVLPSVFVFFFFKWACTENEIDSKDIWRCVFTYYISRIFYAIDHKSSKHIRKNVKFPKLCILSIINYICCAIWATHDDKNAADVENEIINSATDYRSRIYALDYKFKSQNKKVQTSVS